MNINLEEILAKLSLTKSQFGNFKGYAKCAECECEFPVGTRQPNKITCSKDCWKSRLSKSKLDVPMKSRGGKVEVECATCGKLFIKWRNDIIEGRNNCCSRKCSGKTQESIEAKRKNGMKQKGRVLSLEQMERQRQNTRRGDQHPHWKGGEIYRKRHGYRAKYKFKYVKCPTEFMEMAQKSGYVNEYRLKVAIELGRPLTRSECVHHIDHNPINNDIKNLMLFATNSDHKKFEYGHLIEPIWKYTPPETTVALHANSITYNRLF